MHSFLKSIGYSCNGTPKELEELIKTTLLKADYKKEYNLERGGKLVEYIRFTSDETGIIVVGKEDTEGKYHYKYYFPFGVGLCGLNPEDEFYINKKVIF